LFLHNIVNQCFAKSIIVIGKKVIVST